MKGITALKRAVGNAHDSLSVDLERDEDLSRRGIGAADYLYLIISDDRILKVPVGEGLVLLCGHTHNERRAHNEQCDQCCQSDLG